MPGGDTDKTEKATAKRRDEARKKGQVAVSQDLNRALKMMVCLMVFHLVGFHLYMELTTSLRESLSNRLTLEMADPVALSAFKGMVLKSIELLLPFFLAIIAVMLAANIAQVGFKISSETMALNLSKLNPIKGIKKIFSLRSVMKLVWSVLKVLVLALVVYLSLKDRMLEIGELSDQSLPEILAYCFSLLFLILFRIGIVLIILAVFDYAYQRWQYEQDLKMSKEEVKEELKQTIGDPLIKRRIRQAQVKMFKQRMMESVPKATVVVTNPTTYAVAIKYERGGMNAPVVVAKGMNLIAEKIKSIGREHNVPIVENKMLAQTLYRTVEIGSEIPTRLYRAVAEILTYVYKLKGKV
jgi:flagellar biosynthetic protein FlhB